MYRCITIVCWHLVFGFSTTFLFLYHAVFHFISFFASYCQTSLTQTICESLNSSLISSLPLWRSLVLLFIIYFFIVSSEHSFLSTCLWLGAYNSLSGKLIKSVVIRTCSIDSAFASSSNSCFLSRLYTVFYQCLPYLFFANYFYFFTHKCLNILFPLFQMNAVYQHPSLGIRIEVVLKRVVILDERDVSRYILDFKSIIWILRYGYIRVNQNFHWIYFEMKHINKK